MIIRKSLAKFKKNFHFRIKVLKKYKVNNFHYTYEELKNMSSNCEKMFKKVYLTKLSKIIVDKQNEFIA